MAASDKQVWAWRDLFRSVGLAFSLERLLLGLLGIVVIGALDSLIGWGLGKVEHDWVKSLLVAADLMQAGLGLMLVMSAIAFSAKTELIEGESLGLGGAVSFMFKNFWTIVFTPVLFAVFVETMVLIAWVGTKIGGVSAGGAGPLLAALGYLFCYLPFIFLAFRGFLALLFSYFLAPPIIAVRQEGAMDAALDSLDLMRGKGAFWLSLAVIAACGFVAYFVKHILAGGYLLAEMGMKGEFACLGVPMQNLHGWLTGKGGAVLSGGEGILPKILEFFGEGAYAGAAASSQGVRIAAGWIFSVVATFVVGMCASYVLNVFVSAGTMTYLIVREDEEFFLPPELTEPEKKEEKAEEKKQEEKKEDEKKEEGEKKE